MDTKKRKEILKGWAESKGFEFFKEDIEKLLNRNRDMLADIDLFSDTQRAKGVKIQANIVAINEVVNYINNYTKTTRIVSGLEKL